MCVLFDHRVGWGVLFFLPADPADRAAVLGITQSRGEGSGAGGEQSGVTHLAKWAGGDLGDPGG